MAARTHLEPRNRGALLPTGFTEPLERLCNPDSPWFAAVLVDDEGELVDYARGESRETRRAAPVDEAELHLTAAVWQIALRTVKTELPEYSATTLVVTAPLTYAIVPLPHGYALVALARESSAPPRLTDLEACRDELMVEAGWTL